VDEVLAAEETEYMCISIAGVVHMQESIFTQEAAKADDALCKRDNSSAQEGFDWVDFRRCLRRTNGSDTEDVVSKDIASVWPCRRPIFFVMCMGGSPWVKNSVVVSKVGRRSDARIVSGQHKTAP